MQPKTFSLDEKSKISTLTLPMPNATEAQNKINFGRALRKKRRLSGLSVTQAATGVEISVKTWAGYESSVYWPSMPVYIKICQLFRLPPLPFLE